jgi:hypothetical protein
MLLSSFDLETDARLWPWWTQFEEVQKREKFFHWDLEFPEVFLDTDRPGFDAVLGNPPWDKVLPSKHEFYGQYDALIRAYKGNDLRRRIGELNTEHEGLAQRFDAYTVRATTFARVLRAGGDFPLAEARSQAAHEDVAKYFVDRAFALVAKSGAAGLVVPSVFYNGDGWVGIRRYLLEEAAIERFYGFENRKKVFPIDSRYKFVNLVARKDSANAGQFTAAFMRHDMEELQETGAKPWHVQITRQEIEKLSPETLAFLEYRNARDQEIVRKMYAGKPTLGGAGPGSWGASLFSDLAHVQIYNSARDKDLFTDPVSGRPYTPSFVLGDEAASDANALESMRRRGYWPMFEGKHVDQFFVTEKSVRWWLSVERAKQKFRKEPRSERTLVFRDIGRNTDERTCIAAVLPAKAAGTNTLTGIMLERVHPDKAAIVLNSFCFDYALRLRTAGTHVSFTYMLPMPVPPADAIEHLRPLNERFSRQDGEGRIIKDQSAWPALWDLNRDVAKAYGLNANDLRHILTTFQVLARKHPEFMEFFIDRLQTFG